MTIKPWSKNVEYGREGPSSDCSRMLRTLGEKETEMGNSHWDGRRAGITRLTIWVPMWSKGAKKCMKMQKFFMCFVEKSGTTLLAGVIVLSARRLEMIRWSPKPQEVSAGEKFVIRIIPPPLLWSQKKNLPFCCDVNCVSSSLAAVLQRAWKLFKKLFFVSRRIYTYTDVWLLLQSFWIYKFHS